MRPEAAGLLGAALALAPALAAAASPRGIDATWLARKLELAGVSVALRAGAADPLAATTELHGQDGPFLWRILFYECRDALSALGCADYEYVAAAVLSPGDQARAEAWTRRQRIARAEIVNGVLYLRYTISVAGGVSEEFPGYQHERWLDAADDLARMLDVPQASARGAATPFVVQGGAPLAAGPRPPAAVVLSPPAPPAGPSLSAADVRPAPAGPAPDVTPFLAPPPAPVPPPAEAAAVAPPSSPPATPAPETAPTPAPAPATDAPPPAV